MTILPMFAEQSKNAKIAAELGLATILNKFELTKKHILNALLEVMFH